MKNKPLIFISLLALTLAPAGAAVRYVNLANPSPAPPYTSWGSAATNIQDAIDAADAGDEVVVTNGIYATGGRVASGALLTNRVAITKPVTVRSVNGPQATVIRGAQKGDQASESTNGPAAVRCVYLGEGGTLIGFTLTNGATAGVAAASESDYSGAGLWCSATGPVVSNCIVAGNSAKCLGGGVHCESTNAILSNCQLTGNSAWLGGGASGGTLKNCTLSGNLAESGGGANGATLYDCTLSGNSANFVGGGAASSTLIQCMVSGNSAQDYGGGVFGSALTNCTITANSAQRRGGGAYFGTLINCLLTRNSGGGAAGVFAPGVYQPVILVNCTLTHNSEGGASVAELKNCIIYNNTAEYDGANWGYPIRMNYCCTFPLPSEGDCNISADPLLASASHLGVGSPCRGAGSFDYVTGNDIDGQPWANPPSMGCDEYSSIGLAGPLKTAILRISYTNVTPGFVVDFEGLVEGPANASRWDFGDGTVVSNKLNVIHAWAVTGDYPVVLTAYNTSYLDGLSATTMVRVVQQPVHYVALNSSNPSPPYASWATAATNLQIAVDAATVAGALVLVTNGTYSTGGRAVDGYEIMTNRVEVTKPLIVRSVNGPDVTVIKGTNSEPSPWKGFVRCVYLSNGATLEGFSLVNGALPDFSDLGYGGGVFCSSTNEIVSNCKLTGNSAEVGGGAYGGTLNSCSLIGNAAGLGGGAQGCMLNNCSLIGNSAFGGGGASGSTLNDCLLTRNSARRSGGGATWSTLNNCVLSNNSAPGGGGADNSTLRNCTIVRNLADVGGGVYGGNVGNSIICGNTATNGGGAFWSTLNNCTVTGNSSLRAGGGVLSGVIANSIVYFNTAPESANFSELANILNGVPASTLSHCCTVPLPVDGVANFTNAPLFLDLPAGMLRLQAGSPCINAGRSLNAPGRLDLDGNPRIVGGTVDVGAYELQNPASTLSYAWLQQFGLPIDGSADFADPDGDYFNNFQEWRAGTDPMNPLSALRLLTPNFDGINWRVSWQSVSERTYTAERIVDLSATNSFLPVARGVPGQSGTTTVIDTNSPALGPTLYRVRVEE